MVSSSSSSSLASHLCTFLFFFPIGFRRLLSFFTLYLKSSHTHFHAKPWYHSSSSRHNLLTYIDLYILLIAIPIASFSDFYLFLSILPHHFSFLHHQSILTFFWLLLILILFTNHHPLPDTFLFIFAAVAFLFEFHFIDINHVSIVFTNVATYSYYLLSVLSVVCSVSCVLLSVKPNLFFGEFLLCVGLVFKGTWVLQIGLNLYVEMFVFKGCLKIDEKVVKCDLNEDSLRAIAVVNLLFVCHVIVILFGCFVLFALLSLKCVVKSDVDGPLLMVSEVDGSRRVEFEIE